MCRSYRWTIEMLQYNSSLNSRRSIVIALCTCYYSTEQKCGAIVMPMTAKRAMKNHFRIEPVSISFWKEIVFFCLELFCVIDSFRYTQTLRISDWQWKIHLRIGLIRNQWREERNEREIVCKSEANIVIEKDKKVFSLFLNLYIAFGTWLETNSLLQLLKFSWSFSFWVFAWKFNYFVSFNHQRNDGMMNMNHT